MEVDDFRTRSGLVEGTAGPFVNAWKTESTCQDTKNKLKDPCSFSTAKGR